MDSGATAHTVMDDLVLSMTNKPSLGSIGRGSSKVVRGRIEGPSESQLYRGTGPFMLDRFLHDLKIAQSLVSVAGPYHDRQMGLFTKNSRVNRIKRNIVGVHSFTDGLYAVHFQKVGKQQSLAAPEKNISVLDARQARLAQADCSAVKWMEDQGVVWNTNTCQHFVLDDCYPFVKGAITNTLMPSRTMSPSCMCLRYVEQGISFPSSMKSGHLRDIHI